MDSPGKASRTASLVKGSEGRGTTGVGATVGVGDSGRAGVGICVTAVGVGRAEGVVAAADGAGADRTTVGDGPAGVD